MRNQLYINGKNAFEEWGITMDSTALSALMTPPSLKDFISNKVRNKAGKQVYLKNALFDEREITIGFNMTAQDEEEFLNNYAKFCAEVLATGQLTIHTSFLPDIWFRCIYISCTQFSEFIRQMAKFSLKLNEPDPTNRGETSKE